VIASLKRLARRNRRSMEQEVREILAEHVGERLSVPKQIEESWTEQARRPTAAEIETWMTTGRE
jgi:plasmid stability protein